MMRALQANMHRSRTANDLLWQLVAERDADIVIISEQYSRISRGAWLEDESGTAAIWLPHSMGPASEHHGAGHGFVFYRTETLTLMSCYLTPSDSLEQFMVKLDQIEDKIREIGGPFIVAGDFNAKAVEWGERTTNTRGRRIMNMAARLGLTVMNTANSTTFRRPGCEYTTPDITLASDSLAGTIREWRVLEDYTGSDHLYITFQIAERANPTPLHRMRGTRRWNMTKLNPETFFTVFDRQPLERTRDDAESRADTLMRCITRCCNSSMTRIARSSRRRPVYWWSNEIAELRRICLRSRRRYTRAKRHGEAQLEAEDYRQSRANLKRAILVGKKRKWEELRNDLNNNPWGLGYKIVSGKLGGFSAIPDLSAEDTDSIVRGLFPTHPPLEVEGVPESVGFFEPFSEQELRAAAKSLKCKKTPGPDGIPAEILRLVAEKRPAALLGVYNACVAQGIFPKRWKVQKLVLVSKGRGEPTRPSSYRPLCMLDCAGKLLEKLLRSRLAESVEAAGGLSRRQHGFRTSMSAIGAIAEVVECVQRAQLGRSYPRRIIVLATLDVRNAFNSLRWADIMKALREKFQTPTYLLRMIKSYLSDRELQYDVPEGQRTLQITSGAAQGSILGPDLWNITYDGILNIEMPESTHLVGYADDIVAVISAKDMNDARIKLNQVVIRARMWLEDHGLELATDKTEIILMTRAHIPLEVNLTVDNVSLNTRKSLKYLGVRLDCRLTYWAQVRHAASKAARVTGMLSRLMANIGGPTQSKRKLIMTATNSILLYGSEIWGDALRSKTRRKVMEAVQRTAALRVAAAYRTVSAAAVFVISSEIPIDLLAKEKKKIWNAKTQNLSIDKSDLRRQTIQLWQERWSEEVHGRWTAKLIPNIYIWIGRQFGEVNYFMTQFLSNHGYFRKYLYRMGKANGPGCIYCESISDDSEHTFFQCARWRNARDSLTEQIGSFNPGNIVERMLQCENNWNAMRVYVESILREKKRDLDALHQNETREDEPIA